MAEAKLSQVPPRFPMGVHTDAELEVLKFLIGKPATLQSELEKHTTHDGTGGFMPFGEIANLVRRKLIQRGDATKATLVVTEQGMKAYDAWKSAQSAGKSRTTTPATA